MGRLPACIFSPTAPQVENYVDTTGSIPVLSCIYVSPRVETSQNRKYPDYLCTCNVARVKTALPEDYPGIGEQGRNYIPSYTSRQDTSSVNITSNTQALCT